MTNQDTLPIQSRPKALLTGAGVIFLLGLGTLHMWTAMHTLPDEQKSLGYLFLLVNMAVMFIRCSDLFLHERNGSYAKALKRIELLISTILIGLILISCAHALAEKGFAGAWDYCAREILLGGSMVLIFHIFVEVAVRRLRDLRSQGKRRW